MKLFPHDVDPAAINTARRYTVTDAANLLGASRSVIKNAIASGKLRADVDPRTRFYVIKGSNLRLFYVSRVGIWWPQYVDKRFQPRSDARSRSC